jgi:hypothetical protein
MTLIMGIIIIGRRATKTAITIRLNAGVITETIITGTGMTTTRSGAIIGAMARTTVITTGMIVAAAGMKISMEA